MRLPIQTAFLVVLLAAGGLRAQEEKPGGADRDEILAALDLPGRAHALRNKGVEKAEVREALRAARGKKLKAKQTKEMLQGAEEAVDRNGPIDNFGAFVKSRLAEGLRGRELAAAIRAEHQARGKGKGKAKDKQRGPQAGGPEKKERPGKERPQRRPEEEGSGEEAGEPDEERGSGRGSGRGQGERGRGRGNR